MLLLVEVTMSTSAGRPDTVVTVRHGKLTQCCVCSSVKEHYLLPPCETVPVIVYDEEPSSIIAYTLRYSAAV